nr:uncharacterized protein LOC124812466 [Hydra vulgaris]XP_047135145.1 uncharacterized protein LOC124812466 [Hydra vulgaris]
MDRNIESKTFENISFCAYNCQSFKSNSIYISELVKSFDIIFLSEHWLLNIELFVLKNIALPTHKVFFHAAEKKAFGRPFGGNAFIIKKDVILSPHIIYEDDNILAIKGKNKCHNLVFIGIYLTSCRNNEESFSKNEQQLNLITSIVKNYEDVSECIIAGDFQSYPETLYDSEIRNNKKRNKFSNHLTNFIKSNKLSFIDIISGAGPTYTYQHKTLSNSSYIDHIAVLKESSLLFINTSVIPPSPFNFSDHLPNATNIVVTHTNLSTVINSIMHKYNCIPKYAWNNEKFINIYNHNLSAAFNYYTFNEEEIEQELKQTGEKIQNAALLAVKQCFKQQICKYSKSWWTTDLKKCKENLSFNYKQWQKSNYNKNQECIEYKRYIFSRKNFRKAVKAAHNKKIHEKTINIENLPTTNPQRFWDNIRKIKTKATTRLFTINQS